ncbi:ATP-binding protein [Paraburkholderia sp. CI3]|uniref:ATP-binding protein n=1 Tax=Paraburkholderia sp. CI3 TaxID=2991060 RepID=UPI003D1D81F2
MISSKSHVSEPMITEPQALFRFGSLTVAPSRRVLSCDGRPVMIGSRALEILIVLLERAGELVDKRTLMKRGWPSTVVEESNLRAQIAALRRVIDSVSPDIGVTGELIATVPGRGYRFCGSVAVVPELQPIRFNQRAGIPRRLNRVIGRDDAIRDISERLHTCRFVTVTGHGGVGKSTIALQVAEYAEHTYCGGALYLDLSSASTPEDVSTSLTQAAGLAFTTGDQLSGTIAAICSQEVLVVLDGCDHVAHSVALLAEAILQTYPKARVLATSRETLRAQGEHVCRLLPLTAPPNHVEPISAWNASRYSAVELFVERLTSNMHDYALTDDDAPMVSTICRRLDGIPLALEFAAGRVDVFGIPGTLALLDDRFTLMSLGRPHGLERHRTLDALLGWSYDALTHQEQLALRRLGIFDAPFLLNAASFVIADASIAADDAYLIVAALVEKSLVTAENIGTKPTYRLLDVTRAYARARLVETSELDSTKARLEVWLTRHGQEQGAPVPAQEETRCAMQRCTGAGVAGLQGPPAG